MKEPNNVVAVTVTAVSLIGIDCDAAEAKHKIPVEIKWNEQWAQDFSETSQACPWEDELIGMTHTAVTNYAKGNQLFISEYKSDDAEFWAWVDRWADYYEKR